MPASAANGPARSFYGRLQAPASPRTEHLDQAICSGLKLGGRQFYPVFPCALCVKEFKKCDHNVAPQSSTTTL